MNPHAPVTRLWALGAVAAAAALTGCASGLSTSHGPTAQGVGTEQQARSTGEPLVERHAAADARQLLNRYQKRGYVLVAASGFNSDRQASEAVAVAQGRQLGAELVVLLAPRTAGSVARPASLNVPASFRNSPATAFGNNGAGIALEVGPTRTRDALTGHPTPTAAYRTAQRTDVAALYFVRQQATGPAL
ncbi:hypothetical protein [Roseateles sp. LYH14W]|uniref:SPOR domain-containing protein n=1 Tax=Pelomonas parva TaxID=3299032 RepID=A0ABW7FAF0_9BURK